jgi:hypothetical protein
VDFFLTAFFFTAAFLAGDFFAADFLVTVFFLTVFLLAAFFAFLAVAAFLLFEVRRVSPVNHGGFNALWMRAI